MNQTPIIISEVVVPLILIILVFGIAVCVKTGKQSRNTVQGRNVEHEHTYAKNSVATMNTSMLLCVVFYVYISVVIFHIQFNHMVLESLGDEEKMNV